MFLFELFPTLSPSSFVRVFCGAALLAFPYSNRVTAEVPAVTALFPSGVQAGQSVTVKLQGSVGTAPVEVWIDRPDLTVAVTEKPDEIVITTLMDARPGVAWLRWQNAEGASDLRPFLIGSGPEIVEIEPNNATKVAQAIATLPVTINGALDKRSEIDTFSVELKAGQTLVASLDAHRSLPSPIDAVLQLADSHGFIVDQNEDSFGSDPELVWTALSDGTWYIRLFAFPAAPDSSIEYTGSPNAIYRLHLTTGPAIDHLRPLVKQPGEFSAGGWNLTGDKLSLIGEPGSLRLAPLASGAVAFTPFTIDQLPEPVGTAVVEETASASQLVTLHASITGVIDAPGDLDAYRFMGIKGHAIRFRTHTRSLGSALDPLVRFRNSTGQLVTEQDDSGESPDPNFDIIIPVDDEYTVEITDRFGSGSDLHFYSLVIGPEVADFELTLAGNRFTLDRTKPLEIPVTITRLVGLSVPIQFTIEGLPAGVTLEPIESKPEGDTAKAVTLKLTVAPGTAAAKGPIHIIGQTTGPDLKHNAKGPIDGMKVTTDSLWITLPAGG